MTDCVVDASVAVKWYVPEIHSDKATVLLDDDCELHAPDLLVPEFGNILWKKFVRKELGDSEIIPIVRALQTVPLRIYSSRELLEGAVEIATHTSRTVYDCLYLTLAVSLNHPLVTADDRLFNALQNTHFSSSIRHVKDI